MTTVKQSMTRHTADQRTMYAVAADLSAQYRILEGAERRVSPSGNTGHSACRLRMAAKSQTKAFLPDLVALWAPGRAAFDLYTNSAILSSKKCPVKDPFRTTVGKVPSLLRGAEHWQQCIVEALFDDCDTKTSM